MAEKGDPGRSPCHQNELKDGAVDGEMEARGGGVHCGLISSLGWSGAAYGDQSAEGKCRVGFLGGLMSSTLTVPRDVLQWAPG